MITKKKGSPGIPKKGLLLKKITRRVLEEQVDHLTKDLNVIKGQLSQGVSREKIAEESFRGQVSDAANREKLGANREKQGAGREKLAKEQSRRQTNEIEIRDGQIKEGVDRERLAEEQINIRTKAMESTFDGIFIIDAKKPNFPIIYANASFYSLTGYSKKEVIGQNYFLLYGLDENSRIYQEIKAVLRKGQSFQGEMLNFKKSGEKFWSMLRITLVRDKNGIVTHYVGNKTDTTLIKKKNSEIEEQREELLHVTRVGKLAEFVSSLAHEISQPLTAILAYAQAAQRLLKGREPQLNEILQYIINDDQRAAGVIRRMRYLLKKTKPTFEPLDFNSIINDTVSLILPQITAKGKTVKFELDKDLPLVQGDLIQLQQVVLNLISNSLEAMEENEDSHELVIRTSCKNTDRILVEVEDSGSGILPENMDKLFTHFFTSKPDGLGMGLSISRSIVEAHGGHLEARNNPDHGATFYFTIPVNMKKG